MLGIRNRTVGGWLLAGGVLAAVVGACADKKGAVMLAINTDMRAPKDVNAVSITISTGGAIKHSFIGRVTPQGEVLLPATLAIAEPADAAATIRVRVVAFQDTRPRVLRDIRTTVPTGGRVALLRIPLNFVNDGKVVGAPLPPGIIPDPVPGTGSETPSGGTSSGGASGAVDGGTRGSGDGSAFGSTAGDYDFMNAFQPPCEAPDGHIENLTIIDGECADNYVDPATLPDFDTAQLGDSTDVGTCFDLATCFAGALAIGDTQAGADGGVGGPAGGPGNPVPPPDASAGGNCPAGEEVCGAMGCTNTQLDPNNCGKCDHFCNTGAGETCTAGICGPKPFKDFRPATVTVDRATCIIHLNGSSADRLNLAIVTPDTGECLRPGECYVPIDRGPSGWQEQNGVVQLPKYVCTLLNGKNLRLATSSDVCAAKEEKNPICTPKIGDDAGIGGPVAVRIVAEEFATSVAFSGEQLFYASASRIGRVDAPAGAATVTGVANIQVAGAAHLPWRFSAALGGGPLALANGGAVGFVIGADGSGSPVTVAPGTVDSAFINSNLAQFAWGVSNIDSGGLYTSGPTGSAQHSAAPVTDVTAMLGNGEIIVVGDRAGNVRSCNLREGTCSAPAPVAGGGRIDAIAANFAQGGGFVLAQNGVSFVNVLMQPGPPGDGGPTSSTTVEVSPGIPADTSGIDEGTTHYGHGLSSNGPCLFYSTKTGIQYSTLSSAGGSGGTLVDAPSGTTILGLAASPSAVYYAVYAPSMGGGGVWRVPLPAACGGGGIGPAPPKDAGTSGGADAAAAPDGATQQQCGPGNCPTGCCTKNNVCLDFAMGQQSATACGSMGGQCNDCTMTATPFCSPMGGVGGLCGG
jgi:hypothetical protein